MCRRRAFGREAPYQPRRARCAHHCRTPASRAGLAGCLRERRLRLVRNRQLRLQTSRASPKGAERPPFAPQKRRVVGPARRGDDGGLDRENPNGAFCPIRQSDIALAPGRVRARAGDADQKRRLKTRHACGQVTRYRRLFRPHQGLQRSTSVRPRCVYVPWLASAAGNSVPGSLSPRAAGRAADVLLRVSTISRVCGPATGGAASLRASIVSEHPSSNSSLRGRPTTRPVVTAAK